MSNIIRQKSNSRAFPRTQIPYTRLLWPQHKNWSKLLYSSQICLRQKFSNFSIRQKCRKTLQTELWAIWSLMFWLRCKRYRKYRWDLFLIINLIFLIFFNNFNSYLFCSVGGIIWTNGSETPWFCHQIQIQSFKILSEGKSSWSLAKIFTVHNWYNLEFKAIKQSNF